MSESSSESQGESSSSQQYTKGNKLMRKSKSLRLMPSDEELKYRNKNFKNVDLLADYADKLKCTKCNTNFKSDIEEGREVYSHPLLKVLMCKNCCSYYGNGDFSLDEDDEDKYCRWCGEGGTLFLCSKCICGFCPKCIKKHFGIEKRKEIENDDDWICFFCSPEMLYDLRAICAFAIEEANKNKKKLRNKRESKLMNLSKRVSTGSNKKRGGRRSVRNSSPASSSEKESKEAAPVEEVTLDDSSSPEDGGVFKTKQPKKSALKRKRTSNASAKAEAAATTSDGTESDNKKQTKRVRISPRKPKSSAKPSDKKNASDDSTSESDEETNENSKPLPKNLTKSIQKLKDFFKVTEMTAELCVNVCRKKLNKMDKKDFITTSEKLIKESQKLTTVVTLLTTNLTAVSQSVTSLQNKLGLDETNEDDSENVNKKSKLPQVIDALRMCNDLIAEEFGDESPAKEKEKEEDVGPRRSKRKKKDDGDDDGCDDDKKDDSDNSETDIEKCNDDDDDNKKVTKDNNIKLGKLKIRLTRLNVDKDCDDNEQKDNTSVSPEKSINDDAYNVDTDIEDEGGDKEKKDKGDEKDEEKDDEGAKGNVLDSSDEDLQSKKEALDKKKKRKVVLDSSDSDYEKNKNESSDEQNGSDNDSDDAFVAKKSKPKSSKRSESENSSDQDKPKYKRIKSRNVKESSSSESDYETGRKANRKKKKDKDKDTDSPTKGRKNIKRIIKKEKLHVETKQAVKNEEERKKRLKERDKLYKELFPEKLDEDGKHKRLVLDFDPETKEPIVTVHSKLVKKLKPHQVEGVKFMWDNCFESVKKMEEESGSGCILAHCMGLGKTLQVVTLVHTVMTHDLGVNTVLVVCPLNTVSNWINEFEMWLANIHTDPITLYDIIKYKKDYERSFQMEDWQKNGGVMIISYDMFRNLTKEKKLKNKKSKKLQEIFDKSLLDPGPDLVICDEGHLLKNEDTALSKCMRRITTSRRIVLTGTPLQNNLIEYHCMVQFIKPNILGTKKEFLNRFVNPINNGQFEDSTEWDVKVMKRRSHVLHTMLDGCVQRFDYSVLTPFLPAKHEYVISITLSETQMKLYKIYLEKYSARGETGAGKGARLFTDYHHLQRIWTHPHTLLAHDEKMELKKLFNDDEESEGSLKDFVVSDDEESESTASESSEHSVESVGAQRKRLTRSNANDPEIVKEIEEVQKIQEKKWWDDYVTENDYEDLRASYKLVLLFEILKECRKIGDKVLVFSQSLYSLDLIEYFLERVNAASSSKPDEFLNGHSGNWVLGRDYFRLDGSTPSEKRTIWTKYFNKEKNKDARLFLISTRAGGLGINLTAANRVIIFDASWNPSHDVQSIFRVYRFGQTKTCYIYRFLAEATMEEKIYERQVTKLSLAHRVVDEHQIERHYTMNTLMELYTYEPVPPEKRKTPMVPKDKLFAGILKKHKDIIVGYHEHDSLLENKQDEELTEEERKAAWEDFEKERLARPPPPMNYDPNLTEQQQQQQRLAFAQLLAMQSGSNIGNINLQNMQNLNMFNAPVLRMPVQTSDGNIRLPYRPPQQPRMITNADPTKLVNPFHDSGPIPNNLIQRGLLVQVTPYPTETPSSYFNRVRQKEYQLIGQRQDAMFNQLQQLMQQRSQGQNSNNQVMQQRSQGQNSNNQVMQQRSQGQNSNKSS